MNTTTHNFTISQIVKESWSKTKENAWYLFCVFMVAIILMGASPLSSIFVGISIITISLVIIRNETPVFYDLVKSFKNYKILWHYFLASLLYMLILIVGLVALILPGIYFGIRLQFYKFLIIDNENLKPMDALKASMKMTKGHFWKLFGFMIVIMFINIIGIIPLGLGLIVTIPLTTLAYALLYKKLTVGHQIAHPV